MLHVPSQPCHLRLFSDLFSPFRSRHDPCLLPNSRQPHHRQRGRHKYLLSGAIEVGAEGRVVAVRRLCSFPRCLADTSPRADGFLRLRTTRRFKLYSSSCSTRYTAVGNERTFNTPRSRYEAFSHSSLLSLLLGASKAGAGLLDRLLVLVGALFDEETPESIANEDFSSNIFALT